MRELDISEISTVAGGEVGATRQGGDTAYAGTYPSGVACANAMMAYGGLGGTLGGLFGGIGGALGSLGGAWLATKMKVCTV